MTTKTVFVIKNQFDQYLDKQSSWQSGQDANAILKNDHHDQALNALIEVNSKDISLRGIIIEVEIDDKKRPVLEISEEAVALDQALEHAEEEHPSEEA